jgi:hypothetical protein
MKIKKTANNKQKIILSRKEWESLGKKAGWIKESQYDLFFSEDDDNDRNEVFYYDTLSDASKYNDIFQQGSTEVWYAKPEFFGSFMFETDRIDKEDLNKTHILLGQIKGSDLEEIFRNMQGEKWSPKGEARNLIRGKGLAHTSMSVGDIVVINGEIFVCAMQGFKKI